MKALPELFANNVKWSRERKRRDPYFFTRLCLQQTPEYLWIGCSDSRVPANDIVGLDPGELFVHRNIANCVYHNDLNCLCVIQYAVDVLKVKHIMVTGHYGCGGVQAALKTDQLGLVDNWLLSIKDLYVRNEADLANLKMDDKVNKLCELNVIQQVANVCHTTIIQNAWQRQQPLTIHGWIYSLEDGSLHDLDVSVSSPDQTPAIYRRFK